MAEKSKRQTLSKRLRFEIFKRDYFTCQYCGQRPPAAILELDHITPVAAGGGNEEINLITACSVCNSGKSAKILSDRAVRPDADLKFLEAEQEIAEARRYLEAKRERDSIDEHLAATMAETWRLNINPRFQPPELIIFKGWLSRYGAEETEYAIKRCAAVERRKVFSSTWSLCKYIGGILRSIREEEEAR